MLRISHIEKAVKIAQTAFVIFFIIFKSITDEQRVNNTRFHLRVM